MHLSDLSPVPLPPAELPEEVFIGPGVRAEAAEIVSRWIDGPPLVVADPQTAAAFGPLSWAHRPLILPEHPHADDETVARVVEALGAAPGIVTIGSGTINDLGKRAATIAGRPYVTLGTAASMNGYASGIAAILSGGLKTTVASRPPWAIVLDTEILAAAPAALTQAGLGDLLSKPVSDTDWWLADQLEGSGYSTLPGSIVDHAVEEAANAAAGLKARDPAAHGALGAALVLSGVAMVVAGSSSPASGGEHLLSHLWDMENLVAGRETRLHGAQVGVTSCITAALYQRLLKLEAPRFTDPGPWADEAARIAEAHGDLASVIAPQAQRKHARAAARVATLRARWPEIRDGMAARQLPTPEALRGILSAAGAPSTLAELGVTRPDAARVFRLARDIRDRVTVLDVAFEVGVLPNEIDDILDAAGV